MNDFSESQYAFKGPFSKAYVRLASSTRQTPLAIPGTPPPVENEIPISQLPLGGPLFGDELVPMVQNGITCRSTTGTVGSVGLTPAVLGRVQSLAYTAAAGQTVFSCSVPDHYGNMFALSKLAGSVQVTENGVRLVQDDGTGFGGFTLNYGQNAVVLRWPAAAGEVVLIDIYGQIVTPPGAPGPVTAPLSLIYTATAGQTTFPLGLPDHYGNSYALTPTVGIEVTANGSRMVRDDGTGFGGYAIDYFLNAIVFLLPRGVGDVVVVDVFASSSAGGPAPAGTFATQALPITALNVIPLLTFAPDGRVTILFVNGQAFFSVTSPPAFSVTGRTISWLSTIYAITPGSTVVAFYTHV